LSALSGVKAIVKVIYTSGPSWCAPQIDRPTPGSLS
jgi:hypothetical protein